jgi:hypothetical protein
MELATKPVMYHSGTALRRLPSATPNTKETHLACVELRSSLRLAYAALLCALAMRCGGSGSMPAGAPGSSTPGSKSGGGGTVVQLGRDAADFITAYAHAWCDAIGECCKRYLGDFQPDKCVSSAQSLMVVKAEEAITVGFDTPQFNAPQAAECLAQVRDAASQCLAGDPPDAFHGPCDQAFTAMAGPGETCGDTLESATKCRPPAKGRGACQDQRCVQIVPAATGDACSVANDFIVGECDKASGVDCDMSSHRCSPLAAEGASCLSLGCQPELACDGNAHTCRRKARQGESCNNIGCEDGLYCDSVCQPRGIEGALCDPSLVQSTECAASYFCDRGQCAPRLVEGAACSQTGDCQDGLSCSKGSTCSKRLALGEVCTPDTQDVCVQGATCMRRDLSSALQPRSASSPPPESLCVPEHLPLFCWAR